MDKKRYKDSFIVANRKGLHTRPSTELVRCATSFRAQVNLRYKNSTVNAKSLLGILMLAATKGAKIFVEAIGDDAEEAVKSIIQLAHDEFNIKY
jgi:phosphocarrier protein HPr